METQIKIYTSRPTHWRKQCLHYSSSLSKSFLCKKNIYILVNVRFLSYTRSLKIKCNQGCCSKIVLNYWTIENENLLKLWWVHKTDWLSWRIYCELEIQAIFVIYCQKCKWVWSENTIITHCRPIHSTTRKCHWPMAVTSHQEDS